MAEIPGCTVPWAENYNPDATQNDGSCIYLQAIGNDKCYQFSDIDIEDLVDNSFTLSYTIEKRGWSFFHDYWPDFYFHTRSQFMNLKNNIGFYANEGAKGIYHFNNTLKPFFIDILFTDKGTMTLNSVNWLSEVRNTDDNISIDDQPALYNETITAITIWNNYQTSGKIVLTNNSSLKFSNTRNSEENWNFNDFRDIVISSNNQFLKNIFNDYSIDTTKVNTNKSWFDKKLIEGKYFIVRFEFDNNNNKQIILTDMDVDINKSYR